MASANLSNPRQSLLAENDRSGYSSTSSVAKWDHSAAATAMPAVCLCILVVELCERLAFYTFTGTQEFFLEKYGYTLAEAGGINATMSMLCMFWAIFAGWTADVVLGRYRAILVFSMLYVAGAVLSAAAAWPAFGNTKVYMVGLMGLVPIGTAGIKANISNFGADQYDTMDPESARGQERFFSWFYLAINVGSAVAYGGLTTMGSNGGLGVPREYGYFAVYVVAAVAMQIAVFIFLSGRNQYRMRNVQEKSSLAAVVQTVWRAARSGSGRGLCFCVGIVLLVACFPLTLLQALLPQSLGMNSILVPAGFVAATCGVTAVVIPSLRPGEWISQGRGAAEQDDSSATESDVRDYLRLLPMLFTANLAFSALYNSMQFWYQQQACQMDLRMPWSAPGPNQAQFSGSFFMIADCLGIVIATPFALKFANPWLEQGLGSGLTHATKYAIGIGFGVASVLVASHIEQERRLAPLTGVHSTCAPEGVQMSAMQASWMFIPFFLMGLGEIYTQPTLMYVSYTQSPPSMRTLTAATGLVIGGVSTSLFALIISALKVFVPNDLNQGHLEYGYLMNILCGLLFYAAYRGVLGSFVERP